MYGISYSLTHHIEYKPVVSIETIEPKQYIFPKEIVDILKNLFNKIYALN